MNGYVKTFKDEDGDENKNNKLMSLHIDYDKLLEKYLTIWPKIEDLENIELDSLSVCDERCNNQSKSIWR